MEIIFIGILLSLTTTAGMIIGFASAIDEVEDNDLKGYHCQPIVKVKTLEEAKSIIEAHQKRIRSK